MNDAVPQGTANCMPAANDARRTRIEPTTLPSSSTLDKAPRRRLTTASDDGIVVAEDDGQVHVIVHLKKAHVVSQAAHRAVWQPIAVTA